MLHFAVHRPDQSGVFLPDEPATLELGAGLARSLHPHLIIYLKGELGAGKTTLVRGVLQELGYPGRVKSPTYALVEVYYLSRLYLHHFDFYRFKDPAEWIDAGFRDAFGGENVCLIEWPEKAGELLPSADLEVVLEHQDIGRSAQLYAHSAAGVECLRHLTA